MYRSRRKQCSRHAGGIRAYIVSITPLDAPSSPSNSNGRVVDCPSDANHGPDAMFMSILLPRRAEHSRVLDRALLKFKHAHTICDADHGLPIFRRDDESRSHPQKQFWLGQNQDEDGQVADEEIVKAGRHTNQKADEQVEGEKVGKCAKKAQIAEEKKRPTPTL
ncbi:hypothetical protein B0H17DRAFT_1145894 [Mycena rosella]|uniref:Uncharacterized protein n=1 Tax=Mycena rosella TaxID=1033263 RepID=A0AAD7CQ56_MYCRO|nr:hypothetical protein B0H17DRAFT_1145894 [Mycena rosella]